MNNRLLTDNDWPQFALFAEKHFAGFLHNDRLFQEHWFRTPRSDGWAVRILEDSQKGIVGAMMIIIVAAKLGAQDTLLAWISNAAVDDSLRSQGVGAFFYFWVYKTFPLVGAMSGNEISEPINDALGIKIAGLKMRRFIFVHDARALGLCLRQSRSAVLDAHFSPLKPLSIKLTVRWSDNVAPDYDQLWRRFSQKIYCTTIRDRQYLEWRYLRAPYVNYRLLEMRCDSKLHVLAVVRFQTTPEGVVWRVLDFFADEEWATEAWILLSQTAKKERALFTDFMVVGSTHDKYLGDAGFLIADETTGLDAIPHLLSPVEHRKWSNTFHLGGCLAENDRAWRKADAVYFTKGDADRDWPTAFDVTAKTGING